TTHACQLPAPTLSAHLLSSSAHSSMHFGQINSWRSAPRLLLALTQTATNWRLLLLL
ncbi:hypothetical protein ACTXT7_016743, partial [Hymenolepis weldensis]